MKKKVPFAVSKGDARSLVAQVADGFREAIVGGYYVPGDVLPSSRDLCPILGVSRIVTSAALEKLCAEGFAVARRKIGTVIADRSAKRWNGHVVFVYENGDNNYLKTMLASALQGRHPRQEDQGACRRVGRAVDRRQARRPPGVREVG